MSKMSMKEQISNLIDESWPKVGSTVIIHPGTKVTHERDFSAFSLATEELPALVLKHTPSYDWRYDRIEVLVEDQIYYIHRTDCCGDEFPYFNVMEIPEDELGE